MSTDSTANGLVRADPPELTLARVLGTRTGSARRLLAAAAVIARHQDNGLAVLAIRDRATLAALPRSPSHAEREAAHLMR